MKRKESLGVLPGHAERAAAGRERRREGLGNTSSGRHRQSIILPTRVTNNTNVTVKRRAQKRDEELMFLFLQS